MSDLVKPLSKRLKHFQFDRPSEWLMKEFVQQAKELEAENKQAKVCLKELQSDCIYYSGIVQRIKALVDNCVQYQEFYGPDDLRPKDDTVYLKMRRDELKAALEAENK